MPAHPERPLLWFRYHPFEIFTFPLSGTIKEIPYWRLYSAACMHNVHFEDKSFSFHLHGNIFDLDKITDCFYGYIVLPIPANFCIFEDFLC